MAELACIGLGSNLGDRLASLGDARRRIARLRQTQAVGASRVIETDPVGGPDGQGPYLNQAVAVETGLSPGDLLAALIEIEAAIGRPPPDRREPWGPRVIDLDLLLHGQAVIDRPGLQLPHPRMDGRRFVLAPLAEVAPDAVHPVLGLTVAQLLARLPDPGRFDTPPGITSLHDDDA